MIEYLPSIIALVGVLLGLGVGYGVLKTNIKHLQDRSERAERTARDTAIRLDTKVEDLQRGQHQQDIVYASTYVHKDVFEVAMGDVKERLKRIEYKTDKYNGQNVKLEDY